MNLSNTGIVKIESKIYLIRGEKVMLDYDLAELYGVATSRLNEQVKRNSRRFPEDFMFRLSEDELNNSGHEYIPWMLIRYRALYSNTNAESRPLFLSLE